MNSTGCSKERKRIKSTQTKVASVNKDAPDMENIGDRNGRKLISKVKENAVEQESALNPKSAKTQDNLAKNIAQANAAPIHPSSSKPATRSAESMSTEDAEIKYTELSFAGAANLSLATGLQNRIGAQLQSLYNDLIAEDTPDRFLKLLEELDRKAPPR